MARPSKALEKLYAKAAEKILNESLHVTKGNAVTIETWNNGQPLAQQFVMESRALGAIPMVILEDEEAYIRSVKTMNQEDRGRMGKHEYALLSGTDAYIFIPGYPLSQYYPAFTQEERSSLTAYNSSWYEAANKARLRGARLSLGYTTKELARMLGRTQEAIVEHQLKAIINADLTSISARGKQIAEYLQDDATCTVTSSDGSRLEFKLKGETEIQDAIVDEEDLADGYNMVYIPPGFVAKGVDSSSVSGKIKSFATSTRLGAIKDATLEFESGKLTGWQSKTSMKVLDKIVQAINEEARKLTLFSVGLNPLAKVGYGVDRFVDGAISLSTTSRLVTTVRNGSLSVNGREIVKSGKLSIA